MWAAAPARTRYVYAAAALLGLAVYVIAYGPGHVFATSAYWDAHAAIAILPPYCCVPGVDAPRLDAMSRDLQWLASERAMPINGTYCTRVWRRCDAEQAEWSDLAPSPGTLYVRPPRSSINSSREARTAPGLPTAWRVRSTRVRSATRRRPGR